ncbi:prepilin-type N-terminal cleavage/methylation domain-containing protein [Candidatus Pacebacteria bacterium]|nr:prepilin-type N-terminal cleavage/methylation domain-containing protein [Candidatus Paceibacterota bacterium]
MTIKPTQQHRGFTLVEMLVSISIFTIVVTMSVGSLLVLIDANGRAQSTQLVMTNLTFALDSMTREIRTGFNWVCFDSGGSAPAVPAVPTTGDCSTVQDTLSIVESGNSLTAGYSNSRVTYWYDATAGAIKRKLGGDGPWVSLTGSDIFIDDFRFVVTGTDRYSVNTDKIQPIASIYIKGHAGAIAPKLKEFLVQTTVTQRLLDI